MHEVWHECFGAVGGATPPAGRSQRWYAFHRQFEHDFNIWRRSIFFPPIESLDWFPDMNLPHGTGPELAEDEHPSDCEKACRVDPRDAQDHGDGTYTVAIQVAPGTPGVRLAVAGASFDVALPCDSCPRLGRVALAAARTSEHSFTKGTVRLSAPAPRGGAVVHLASSNAAAAVVPASVVVPEGQQEATFEIAVHHAHNGPSPATISASYGADRSAATLTVLPLKKGTGSTKEPPATPVRRQHEHGGGH